MKKKVRNFAIVIIILIPIVSYKLFGGKGVETMFKESLSKTHQVEPTASFVYEDYFPQEEFMKTPTNPEKLIPDNIIIHNGTIIIIERDEGSNFHSGVKILTT
ncbi:MAG: hypothetical protein WC939_01510 [Acholeplasmataceae bacterium]